ncbi:MAG: DMT family transporter [Clostridiaceae bacterium]|jgi:drug/metabolite transporter (DMT)-like permease|nr:DMT family transporter [Clostridia bacterium]NLG29971.1 DMT family transporter [Clostridiaceae bacterium]
MPQHIGEIAAIITALCWALNGVAFEAAGRRVGAMAVNYLRIVFALILLSLTAWVTRGLFFPVDASASTWLWLVLSGFVGFVLGDMFLFEAFLLIGSRVSMLIMAMAPPLAALIGYLVMDETITGLGLLGIFIIMAGISLVIMGRNADTNAEGLRSRLSPKGLFYAFLGALGQALGLILSKIGMGGTYNAIAATQIRAFTAVISLTIVVTIQKKWPAIRYAFTEKRALRNIATGAVIGPFIGVTLSLVALQYTSTGIVSSLNSLSPVFIIPISMIVFKEKVMPKEVIGAILSVAGVMVLFL